MKLRVLDIVHIAAAIAVRFMTRIINVKLLPMLNIFFDVNIQKIQKANEKFDLKNS